MDVGWFGGRRIDMQITQIRRTSMIYQEKRNRENVRSVKINDEAVQVNHRRSEWPITESE